MASASASASAAAASPRAVSPHRELGAHAASPRERRSLGIAIDPFLADIFKQRHELQGQRLALLAQQKSVATDLHRILDDPKDGINFHTERERRNIVAAIVVARQMGYFRYYKVPEESRRAEKYVPSRVQTIQSLQADMDAIDAQLAQLDRAQREHHERPPPPLGSLVAWFQANGRPEGFMGDAYKLTVTKSTRRLGATKHYPAFESVASKLKLGMSLRQLNLRH